MYIHLLHRVVGANHWIFWVPWALNESFTRGLNMYILLHLLVFSKEFQHNLHGESVAQFLSFFFFPSETSRNFGLSGASFFSHVFSFLQIPNVSSPPASCVFSSQTSLSTAFSSRFFLQFYWSWNIILSSPAFLSSTPFYTLPCSLLNSWSLFLLYFCAYSYMYK